MSRFKLPWDATIVTKGQSLGSLPMKTLLSIRDVIAGQVEIFEPVIKEVSSNFLMNSTALTSLCGEGTFNGVEGTSLASLQSGDQIKVSI